ncbi:MAG: DUF4133 domain-containing protein [Sphingobacteriia bacterium]|nr:DUF4133 domain-containing protein [Sphingobacteriia bacterium]
MSNMVYHINKGINASIEFKGLRAQYIWYLGGGLVAVLILFAVLYICGINAYICVAIAAGLGGFVFVYVYRLNNKYGQYGLMRKMAARKIPTVIHCHSRKALCKENLRKY